MQKLIWQKALGEFIKDVKKSFQKEIDSIILFGSQARGDAIEGSDIDLLVVLSSEADIKRLEKVIDGIASDVSLKYDLVISLIYLSKNRFEQRSEPLLINIRKEGKKIA